MTGPRLLLVDEAGRSGRTTATLLSSLATRLASLHFVTGADAVGSITAGFAALGRRVAATAEGAALLSAIEKGRAGANGERIWSALSIGTWASGLPPSPVLDQLRNDVALLLAHDLDTNLDLPPLPPQPPGGAGTGQEALARPGAPTAPDALTRPGAPAAGPGAASDGGAGSGGGDGGGGYPYPDATFGHYLLGMWAFAREVVGAVEALTAATAEEAGAVAPGPGSPSGPEGPLLR